MLVYIHYISPADVVVFPVNSILLFNLYDATGSLYDDDHYVLDEDGKSLALQKFNLKFSFLLPVHNLIQINIIFHETEAI